MANAIFAAAYVIVYALVGWMLAAHPTARLITSSILLIAPPAAIGVVILRRRRQWLGCQRLFWDAFAIGLALWVVGHVGFTVDAILSGTESWFGWHTIFSLCGGIGPLVALLARPHRGVRASSTGAVAILVGSYALLAVFVYAYFVLIPGLLPAGPGGQLTLLWLVQVNRLLLMLGMVAGAWMARGTPWRRTFALLAAGASAGFFLRVVTSFSIVRGTYQTGSLFDLAWLIPFLMFLLAAREAPASEPEPIEAPGPPAIVTALPVFIIPLVGYGLLFVQPIGGTGDSVRGLLTGVLTVAALGLLTLRLAAQGGALQRADQRWRLLAAAIEQTGDAIVITRADGSFEHANDAFLKAAGYTRTALRSLNSADLAAAGFEMLGRQVYNDVRHHGMWRGTIVRRRKDGSAFHAASTVVGVRDASGRLTHLVGVERDISDDLKLRDQLVHAERLSAIGALVGGIAHEVNNPLQTILGIAELLLEENQLGTARSDLDLVRREAARAAHIVRNLLSFVRQSTPGRTPDDLNDIVRSAVELRAYHLERCNMTLRFERHPEPLPVRVNREEILQIVLNLILNSEQALDTTGAGGTITLRTFPDGDYHGLDVSDTGPGISDELRGKIFEPFFTTKDVGQGTGLGLSISHGIALSHGGTLELCETTSGACFRLVLPAYTADADAASRYVAAPVRGVALIIDDEAAIRRVLARLLELRGFEVFEAESGERAVAIAREHLPQVVVCDLRMPGMSGIDVYVHLSEISPDIRRGFVFMSGDSAQTRADGLAEGVPILKKPFTSADLDAILAVVS